MKKLRPEFIWFYCLVLCIAGCVGVPGGSGSKAEVVQVEDPWWHMGSRELHQRIQLDSFPARAKNVIVFIGDGMGISTITAARIYDGQEQGLPGEEHSLSFGRFPNVALVKTYNSDSQVPDSAGTASAINTGIKSPIGTLNIFHGQRHNACAKDSRLPTTLAEIVESNGKSTGVVTTTRVTHATPAAVFAHSPNRGWEYDGAIPGFPEARGCSDIARQLVEFPVGDGLDVVLGGGKRNFLPKSKGGLRTDNRDLLAEWQTRFPQGQLVSSRDQLAQLSFAGDKPVLGLFGNSNLAYESVRDATDQPSLEEMTAAAISRLSANPNGYYLMVEGGRIDHAHHATHAGEALNETRALSRAVARAVQMVDLQDTLVLVTADHSHTFVMGGYPKKGNPILGFVQSVDRQSGEVNRHHDKALDGQPYTTLGYFTGPRVRNIGQENGNAESQVDQRQWQAAIPMSHETHGGEDVALFATGAGSGLVSGVMEQHTIFHIIAYALRLPVSADFAEQTK